MERGSVESVLNERNLLSLILLRLPTSEVVSALRVAKRWLAAGLYVIRERTERHRMTGQTVLFPGVPYPLVTTLEHRWGDLECGGQIIMQSYEADYVKAEGREKLVKRKAIRASFSNGIRGPKRLKRGSVHLFYENGKKSKL